MVLQKTKRKNAMNPPNYREMRLWYKQPAAEWVEALPIGNGRLGAMVFGQVWEEELRFHADADRIPKRSRFNVLGNGGEPDSSADLR